MNILHPQESIIKTYNYNGMTVDLVLWTDTIWCGKMGYADSNTDEPNVEKIMKDFMFIPTIPHNREEHWDVCISVNYLSNERPNGVMFGFLVATDIQPDSYDIYKIPSAKYLRIRLCDETASLLGHEPWMGGIPPYHWIGEQIAPKLGYTYGDDTLPIVEYYGFFSPEEGRHEYCYLYVPVREQQLNS